MSRMQPVPHSPEALELLHRGSLCMAEIESNGIRIDIGYVQSALKRTEKKIARLDEALRKDEVAKVWLKRFGNRTNLSSHEQLGSVLFDQMGFESPGQTGGGRHSTSKEALETVEHPFVDKFLEIQKLKKAVGTNLKGILRETVDGHIHSFLPLHTTRTFRGSSEDPNLQNIPIRDEEIGPLIRQAFIARPGRHLVEVDLSNAEVRTSASYHKDPNMIEYILDPTKDMHRDTAAQLFKLSVAQVKAAKPIRQEAKSNFVFAQFYGSWYINCAPKLWKASRELKLGDGTPLRDHLASVGITELGAMDSRERPEPGTFEHQVQKVEQNFWDVRFATYSQWKKDWYAAYQDTGWFQMLTGFACQGYMKKNDVTSYPIQGTSFHCLLWCLIRIMDEIKKRGMKTKILTHVHDSILADVPPNELGEYLHICYRVITSKLRRQYPWLACPMAAEADVVEVGESWAQKKPHEMN